MGPRTRLSYADKTRIMCWLQEKIPNSQIAARLDRHPLTIWRHVAMMKNLPPNSRLQLPDLCLSWRQQTGKGRGWRILFRGFSLKPPGRWKMNALTGTPNWCGTQSTPCTSSCPSLPPRNPCWQCQWKRKGCQLSRSISTGPSRTGRESFFWTSPPSGSSTPGAQKSGGCPTWASTSSSTLLAPSSTPPPSCCGDASVARRGGEICTFSPRTVQWTGSATRKSWAITWSLLWDSTRASSSSRTEHLTTRARRWWSTWRSSKRSLAFWIGPAKSRTSTLSRNIGATWRESSRTTATSPPSLSWSRQSSLGRSLTCPLTNSRTDQLDAQEAQGR